MKLVILGATGSIGVNTLDVVARHPDRFEVVALTGHRQVEALAAQCRQFRPAYAVVAGAAEAGRLAGLLRDAGLRTEVLHGAEALVQVASLPEVDAVMAAIVGAAGLPPTLAAARAGKRVLAGQQGGAGDGRCRVHGRGTPCRRPAAADRQRTQCGVPVHAPRLRGRHAAWGGRRILLTASGGPFRTTPLEQPDDGDAGAGGRASQLVDGQARFRSIRPP
jgi:1-deoxy-D-xylulose-5-phosphate reductoisomerase